MKQRGVVILELALCLPILLLVILGGLDLVRLQGASASFNYVTETTASCYAKSLCGGPPQAYAQTLAQGVGMNPAAVTMSCSGYVCSATYAWQGLGFPLKAITLNATATGTP